MSQVYRIMSGIRIVKRKSRGPCRTTGEQASRRRPERETAAAVLLYPVAFLQEAHCLARATSSRTDVQVASFETLDVGKEMAESTATRIREELATFAGL